MAESFPNPGVTCGLLLPLSALSWDLTAVWCALMSTVPQSTPLTDTQFFLFFHSPAPVLGCQTVQTRTLLPSLQRNNRLCDKGSHDAARGTPNVEAGRSSFQSGSKVHHGGD